MKKSKIKAEEHPGKCSKSKNVKSKIKEEEQRAHPGSNRRPIDLQSIALPLSYGPIFVQFATLLFISSRTTLPVPERKSLGIRAF